MYNAVQLVIYAEGTRSTPEKQLASQQFCQERGLPVFNVARIHLVPPP